MALVLLPGFVVLSDIPAVSIQIGAYLFPDHFCLEKRRQEARSQGASTLGSVVHESDEIFGKGHSDLHDIVVAKGGIPGYSIRYSCERSSRG